MRVYKYMWTSNIRVSSAVEAGCGGASNVFNNDDCVLIGLC